MRYCAVIAHPWTAPRSTLTRMACPFFARQFLLPVHWPSSWRPAVRAPATHAAARTSTPYSSINSMSLPGPTALTVLTNNPVSPPGAGVLRMLGAFGDDALHQEPALVQCIHAVLALGDTPRHNGRAEGRRVGLDARRELETSSSAHGQRVDAERQRNLLVGLCLPPGAWPPVRAWRSIQTVLASLHFPTFQSNCWYAISGVCGVHRLLSQLLI